MSFFLHAVVGRIERCFQPSVLIPFLLSKLLRPYFKTLVDLCFPTRFA